MTDARLGVLEAFDAKRSIDLTAASRLIPAERSSGRRLNVNVLYRWVRVGWKPRGFRGPLLRCPAVLMGNKWLTMPGWVEAFQAARVEMGRPSLVVGKRTETASHRAACERLRAQGLAVG